MKFDEMLISILQIFGDVLLDVTTIVVAERRHSVITMGAKPENGHMQCIGHVNEARHTKTAKNVKTARAPIRICIGVKNAKTSLKALLRKGLEGVWLTF
jgi:hypothetical protein